jgi:hypothetical protein
MIYYNYKDTVSIQRRKRMKAYSATVREKGHNEVVILCKSYNNLEEFKADIKANGYRVYRNHIAETARFNWILDNTNGDDCFWRQKTGIETIR